MTLALVMAGFLVGAPSVLESARDQQDRATLQKTVNELAAAASKTPNDPDAYNKVALAWSYLAEVNIELHDRKQGRQAAEQGIKAAERALALRPSAENYRILATLYGQAITDVLSGLSYGPKAKEAIGKAVEAAPKSSAVWVARGVGNYYLPAQFGGGAQVATADFRKALDFDPKNAEAYLWLGVSLRKENKDAEARQAFQKSLELNPNRLWVKQQLEKTPAK
jgi:tetratricopeptide (TPR) repeat protein